MLLPAYLPVPMAQHAQVRRLKLSLQYKDTQFAHESKKREKEYERLKQKLGQVRPLLASYFSSLDCLIAS